ncbi:MAG: hypothetical protein JO240_16170 [Solirubrobacterales bacterium]|nr:hypothetical protein [Solirubrobacterales bacterium]
MGVVGRNALRVGGAAALAAAAIFVPVATAAPRHANAVDTAAWRHHVNPLRRVRGLQPGRIDMGVDYAGAGPIRALGKGRVTMASDHDSGPVSCWGRTCWPGGGVVVYRLLAGPFAGKYVYVAEDITVRVKRGQIVRAGQRIATLHDQFPYMETGWASGKGPETLAIARGHQCRCGDPGGWSTIEGRNFDQLLVALGAPSGYLQPNPPRQRMPRRWPRWRRSRSSTASIPQSTPTPQGSTR